MTRMLVAGLVFGALIGPATAADLPVKAPPPAPVSTWDGWYLGVSVGWEQTNPTWTTTCFTNTGACPAGFPVDATSPHSFRTSGGRVGGYFGVNWQVAPTWVVGVEADFGFYDRSSTVIGIVGCTINCGAFIGATPAFDSTSVRTTWDASIRARLGFLVTPTVMLYGTAGLAEKEMDANVTCTGATSPWCTFNHNVTFASHVQPGWTVGAGIDWKAYGNWIVRAEYRYFDFGTWSPIFFQNTVDEIHADIRTRSHVALFGVSYLFGGTGAVVAKY